MTWQEYQELQVGRSAQNWMKPTLIWWRPVPIESGEGGHYTSADESPTGQAFKLWDLEWPQGCLRSDDNPCLGIPPGQLINGNRINLATNQFWTKEELDELKSVESFEVTLPKEIEAIAKVGGFDNKAEQARLNDLKRFAKLNDLDPTPIVTEQIKTQQTTIIIAKPQINEITSSVTFKFIKPPRPKINNKELLRQLKERRLKYIQNQNFFPPPPVSRLRLNDPVLKVTPKVVSKPTIEQTKLVNPHYYIDIEFPDETVTEVRNDLWELACGKCYLTQTHFLHQKDVFVRLYHAFTNFIKHRQYAFEKFTFAMQHNLFHLTSEDNEPVFDDQQTFWKVLEQLRRVQHRVGRLAGIIKSKRGVLTEITVTSTEGVDQRVNMDECWVALFERNSFAEPFEKLTDPEIQEEMFKLFPHMRLYIKNNPRSYDVRFHRKKYNCGYFFCQGKRRPERWSHQYRRIPSVHEGSFTVWQCKPNGKIVKNITPTFKDIEAAKKFLKERTLKIDIKLDPNRGQSHVSQIGRSARFRQIGQIGPLINGITKQPNIIPPNQQDKITKEVDGTIKYVSELEAEDFDPRLSNQQAQDDDLNF